MSNEISVTLGYWLYLQRFIPQVSPGDTLPQEVEKTLRDQMGYWVRRWCRRRKFSKDQTRAVIAAADHLSRFYHDRFSDRHHDLCTLTFPAGSPV